MQSADFFLPDLGFYIHEGAIAIVIVANVIFNHDKMRIENFEIIHETQTNNADVAMTICMCTYYKTCCKSKLIFFFFG